jgi:hypothetical protein
MRIGLALANLALRVSRVQFRIFLHPPDRILATAEEQGLRTVLNQPGLLWHVAAFERG